MLRSPSPSIWTSLLVWYGGSRLVIATLGAIGVATFVNHHTLTTGNLAATLSPEATWHKWDALWYQRIALHGYGWEAHDVKGQAAAGFFPAYPLIVGLLLPLFPSLSFFWVATLFSNLLTIAALALIATRLSDNADQMQRTLVILVTSAGSFYLSIPYTESLFLLLVAGAMVLTRDRRYVLAAGLSGLAAVTRVQGAALIIVPLLACWRDPRLDRRARLTRLFASAAIAAVPVAAYLLHLDAVQGDSVAFLSRQTMWDNAFPYPLKALVGVVQFPGRLSGWIHGAFWFIYVGLLVRYWRRLPPGEALFCAGALLISTQQETFHGIYRYTMPLIPLALALADDQPRIRRALIALNLVFGAIMILAFVTNNRLAV